MSSANKPLLPEWEDMQGLIASAYAKHPYAVYLLLRMEEAALTRRWLGALLADNVVTRALKHKHGERHFQLNIAFTADALKRLASQGDLKASLQFVEGIAGREHRSRMLGDTGKSDPKRWRWGGPHQVDVLLMMFGRSQRELDDGCAGVQLDASGMFLVHEVRTGPFDGAHNREHFGFRDGISQPILMGTTEAERFPESRHLTALGEVVFGYPDGTGSVPCGPSFTTNKDFGRNGSYLVIRQLHQNVGEFWKFMEGATCMGNTVSPEAEDLASKVVGRRMDGTPLVPYAATSEDNEFGFGEDVYGYGCPAGAHIRRGNPRDMFPSDSPPLEVNRHRILRRGRPYGPVVQRDERLTTDDKKPRGLVFIGLNSDIERQFEFIQQNWVNNPAFAGLPNERDPLIGDHGLHPHGRFTIAGTPAPVQVTDLPRFIETAGGEYFFLPGLRALEFLVRAGVPGQSVTTTAADEDENGVDGLIEILKSQLKDEYAPPRIKRDAHPKMHGCVQAEFQVEEKICPEFRHGVFAWPGRTFNAWVRFSNAFHIQHDLDLDTRGMGIKLLDVEGPKLDESVERTTQDFVLATHSAFFLPNVKHYQDFARSTAKGPLYILGFFLRHGLLRGLIALGRSRNVFARNPLALPYFSQTPYLLGSTEIKVQASPQMSDALRRSLPGALTFWLKRVGVNAALFLEVFGMRDYVERLCDRYIAPKDFLRHAMMSFLAGHDAAFDILIQVKKKGMSDNPTIPWRESQSKFLKVATLRIPRQLFWPEPGLPRNIARATSEMAEFGENMSFSPWHSLADHKPLGEINEARKKVYRAISGFRRSENYVDDQPDRLLSSTEKYLQLRSIVQIGREPARSVDEPPRSPEKPAQSPDVEGV